ncbi:ComEC/Rec2 family competence protein [Flavobacterium sp. SM2513]|uniref:ComEC/Rec2 family competence protein n=1 Tax=Flavobacterium sp. SM2513 TaxID=3424766 RepID=UPI003D7FA764
MKVLQYPLTQITFLFVFGIVLNRYLNLEFNIGLLFLVGSFSLFLIAFLLNFRSKSGRFLKIFTVFSLVVSFCLGNFTAIAHQATNDKTHYFHTFNETDEAVSMKLVLIERWKPTLKNNRFVAKIYTINDKPASGKILLNFRKDSTAKDFNIGMKVAVHAKLFPIQKPLNPDQFDYGSFLKNKSIYGQVYADNTATFVFNSKEKSLYYYSAIFRNRVIENLSKSDFNQKELGVVQALILGQRQDLDPTILQDYQYAGAIHILSVSGLHVGFVLLFLNYLLNFLPNTNRFRVFKVVTIILILWCFALVAGFSPSVVRSVTMFSFVAIGMYMKRKTYVFYTFYCSIFLILLFQPSFLFDVGFQLSYMAVFFILWLQPELVKLLKPKNKITNHLWQVFTITLTAQLGTMPLSLYYFHQFPGLFFVTNLLIMFLMTLIMGVGLLFVLIAFFTKLPAMAADILEKLIWLLNLIIEKIASYESFIFKNISFDFWMMATCYLLVFAIGWFFIRRNFRTTALVLIAILLFQMSCFSFDISSRNKEEWIVFQERNSSLFLERRGNEVVVFSNKDVSENRNLQSFNVANGTSVKELYEIPNLMYFHDKKILVLDSSSVFSSLIKPDILVITQSPKINFERFFNNYKPEIVIVDASNYRNVVEHIQKICDKQKIPFHAVAEKGFYRIEK